MNRIAVVILPKGVETQWALRPIAGIPLVERNLMALKSVGVEKVHVCCEDSPDCETIGKHLSERIQDRRLPAFQILKPNDDVRASLPELFIILDGRRIYHSALLRQAVSANKSCCYVKDSSENLGIGVLSNTSELSIQSLLLLEQCVIDDELFAEPADSISGKKRSQKLLFRSLIKKTDGWVSVHLNRPISLSVSKLLSPYPVHPNVVTLFTFLVGVASGILPAFGTYWGFALGGILFHLASILDGTDGEISRIKFLGSRLGQWLDTICDDLTIMIFLSGISFGIHQSNGSPVFVWMGFSAAILYFIIVSLMYWQLVVRFRSGTLLGFEWDIKKPDTQKNFLARFASLIEPFFKRDSYAIAFMIVTLLGCAWLVIPLGAIGTCGTLITLVTQLIKGRRKPAI